MANMADGNRIFEKLDDLLKQSHETQLSVANLAGQFGHLNANMKEMESRLRALEGRLVDRRVADQERDTKIQYVVQELVAMREKVDTVERWKATKEGQSGALAFVVAHWGGFVGICALAYSYIKN